MKFSVQHIFYIVLEKFLKVSMMYILKTKNIFYAQDLRIKYFEGQNGTATKWYGRQNDTVRHFGTEGHFDTATKWHDVSI